MLILYKSVVVAGKSCVMWNIVESRVALRRHAKVTEPFQTPAVGTDVKKYDRDDSHRHQSDQDCQNQDQYTGAAGLLHIAVDQVLAGHGTNKT